MAGAGLTFRASRLLFLRCLGEAGLRGAGLSAVAGGAAFNLEALSFPLLNRLTHTAFGRPADWSRSAVERDVLSSYLFLGGMRGAGMASRKLRVDRFTRQASIYGGVVAGTYLESLAGLKHFDSPSHLLAHSLGTYLQFQIAGRALHEALGPGFGRMESRMDQWAAALEKPFSSPLPIGVMAMAEGPTIANMSQGLPADFFPARPSSTGLRLAEPTPETPARSRAEIAAILLKHRGNHDAAAVELGLSPQTLRRRLEAEDGFSEFSVFSGRRMLFYRPALSRAHSVFGADLYRARSLEELGLSLPASRFLSRLEIQSLWDLLLTQRNEFHQAASAEEPVTAISAHLREIEQKFDRRIANGQSTVLPNHPLGEGDVKSAIGQIFRDYPIEHLGLEPRIDTILGVAGIHTVGELMARPIPRWIPRDGVPPQSSPGTREALTDSVIRSVYALMNGAPPRRYRPPVPDRPSLELPLPLLPERPPRLEGVEEADLIRRMIAFEGRLDRVAESFSRPPRELLDFIQRHDANSELNIYQIYGKGTMLFYTPALRQAMSLWGEKAHRGDSLAGLGLDETQLSQLRAMGVESLRDVFLLTDRDFEKTFGSLGAREAMAGLDPNFQSFLNREGLDRHHLVFRPGLIKDAIGQTYARKPLAALDLPPITRKLLEDRGLSTIGALMARPIPDWIRQSQFEGSPDAGYRKAEQLDRVIRSTYALLLADYRPMQ